MSWPHAGGIVFGYILISVFTLMHGYVVGQAASVPFLKRHVPRIVCLRSGEITLSMLMGMNETWFPFIPCIIESYLFT